MSCKSTKPCKEKLGEGKSKIFEEEISQESCHSVVGPTTMHEQNTFQVPINTSEEDNAIVIVQTFSRKSSWGKKMSKEHTDKN